MVPKLFIIIIKVIYLQVGSEGLTKETFCYGVPSGQCWESTILWKSFLLETSRDEHPKIEWHSKYEVSYDNVG